MAIFSAEMLTRDRGELLGLRADELVVGSSARAALGEPFGDPASATSHSIGNSGAIRAMLYCNPALQHHTLCTALPL